MVITNPIIRTDRDPHLDRVRLVGCPNPLKIILRRISMNSFGISYKGVGARTREKAIIV